MPLHFLFQSRVPEGLKSFFKNKGLKNVAVTFIYSFFGDIYLLVYMMPADGAVAWDVMGSAYL
jgi:hypothetical protein